MKRKRHRNRSSRPLTPANQKTPPGMGLPKMGTIVDLVCGWERLKTLTREIQDRPKELADLMILSEAKPEAEQQQSEDLYVIAREANPAARLVLLEKKKQASQGAEITPLAVIILWETSLSHAAQGIEAHARWLASITVDERTLIIRLQKRVSNLHP
jgi:hypothetical protein